MVHQHQKRNYSTKAHCFLFFFFPSQQQNNRRTLCSWIGEPNLGRKQRRKSQNQHWRIYGWKPLDLHGISLFFFFFFFYLYCSHFISFHFFFN
jgi:hypothetical protein